MHYILNLTITEVTVSFLFQSPLESLKILCNISSKSNLSRETIYCVYVKCVVSTRFEVLG